MNDVVVMPRTSTTAIVSLIFGVLTWFALPFIGAIIAVICGHAARSEIAYSGGRVDGAGLALTGLLLGWIHLSLFIGAFLLLLALPFGLFGGLHWILHFLQSLPECGTTTTA
ncbi:MAG: hypothetical protein JWR16_3037 [Nevskia sp.]|nr:hypothetical protein [Nevskia sp.]